jgi:uncharacterized membrane protein YcaP (DUF421 family)
MNIDLNNLLEIVLRVGAIYIIVLFGLRLMGKREIAQLSVVDFVLVLLISNAVQNAMLGPDTTLLGGIVAAIVLFGINFLLKLLETYSSNAKKFLEGNPVVLIYKGKVNDVNLRRARISTDELVTAVREHGVKSIADVDLSMLEVNGNISILSGNFTSKSEKDRPNKKHNHK